MNSSPLISKLSESTVAMYVHQSAVPIKSAEFKMFDIYILQPQTPIRPCHKCIVIKLKQTHFTESFPLTA